MHWKRITTRHQKYLVTWASVGAQTFGGARAPQPPSRCLRAALAHCSFDKLGLISIIFGKQHQHTFKNDMNIEVSLSLHFYLICDENDAKITCFYR